MKKRILQFCVALTVQMLCVATASGTDMPAVEEDALLSDPGTGSRARAQWQQRFIGEFSDFAGSAENAQSLYSGLRSGTRITLTRATANSSGSAGTAVLQFNPAGLPMGIGSAFISMALAKQQLAGHGITRPAPAQIQAALNGGAVTPGNVRSKPVVLKGVLAQREQGMGWHGIAKASGISLRKVLDGVRDPSTEVVAVGGGQAPVRVQAAARGGRHAAADGVPGPMRASASVRAPGDGLVAQ